MLNFTPIQSIYFRLVDLIDQVDLCHGCRGCLGYPGGILGIPGIPVSPVSRYPVQLYPGVLWVPGVPGVSRCPMVSLLVSGCPAGVPGC